MICRCGRRFQPFPGEIFTDCFECWVQARLDQLARMRQQEQADDWYAAEVERMKDRAPA